MRTSLSEILQIENWLLQRGEVRERLVTEARVLANPEIREKALWQSITYECVRLYGREKLQKEINAVEEHLFNAPQHRSFQHRISSIFKK